MQDAEDFTTKIKLDKNVLTISQDPLHHGFWVMSLDRGSLPDKFKGRYTRKSAALQAAKAYMDARSKKD